MSSPSDGIIPDLSREMMPRYHLSRDLLQAIFAPLPPPPGAPPDWRQASLPRLTQGIFMLMPANAVQAVPTWRARQRRKWKTPFQPHAT